MKNSQKYLLLFLYLFFAALNFNLILKELNLVTGGTQGLAILINKVTNLSPATIVLIINVIALIISYFFLTKDNTKSALIATFAYPIFIKITSFIPPLLFLKTNILITVIISGIIYGFTSGGIYKLGFSSGGITILNLLIRKYFNLHLSIINFIVNALIIIASYFVFSLEKALYSVLLILMGSIVIHFFLKKKY